MSKEVVFYGIGAAAAALTAFFVPFPMKAAAAFVQLSFFHSYIPCLQA